MNHEAIVREFLKNRTSAPPPGSGLPFVTISRQAGAGGNTLAHQLVKTLSSRYTLNATSGWEVFDQKLCTLVLEDGKIKASLESLLAEEYVSEIRQFVGDLLTGQSRQYAAYKRIFEVVRLLASIGKVVLVGRAAAFVTRDMPQGIRVRLVAGEAERIKNMAALLRVHAEDAEAAMREQDLSRARLVRDYFDADVADPLHYHMVFNTEKMPMAEIAEVIAERVAARVRPQR
ncbi:MAG TPA: cytidylate kinase-like family protein [Kiritimatiellia bacterium]|nr:cytidylate kinase-like family protein [Kiritimatiellia bacterium]